VLHSFQSGADGAEPFYSDLVFDDSGNLYGTAYYSGKNNYGIVFELSPAGTNWTESILYSFAGGKDGANPASGLVFDKAGNLYGTTVFGGTNGTGTVFELSLSGGVWKEQVIYSSSDVGGFGTQAGLSMDIPGNIFGATSSTVFELSPNGKGGWNSNVIHSFTGAPKDGSLATGTPVLDGAGNVYGTTFYGGSKNYGTVYKLSPGKKGKWTKRILHSFKSGKDGADRWRVWQSIWQEISSAPRPPVVDQVLGRSTS